MVKVHALYIHVLRFPSLDLEELIEAHNIVQQRGLRVYPLSSPLKHGSLILLTTACVFVGAAKNSANGIASVVYPVYRSCSVENTNNKKEA